MTHFYDSLNNPEDVSVLDELSLWSAPFGLRLLDAVHYRRDMNALDIGCGLGFPLIELAMRLGNTSRIYGIDPWNAGIAHARQKIARYKLTNAEVVEGYGEQMPFGDNYFDLIVSNNGINNVKDIEKTFEECRRVSKSGAQFAFTFNTNQTFIEFYDVYRKILNECGLQEYKKELDAHIYEKRKPTAEFVTLLEKHNFKIMSIHEDNFHYRFSDGSAMLNHFFMKLAFLPSWRDITPESNQAAVFHMIEERLNLRAKDLGHFSMRVPFVTVDCEKG